MNPTTFDYRLWLYRLIIIGLIAVTVFVLCQQYVAQQVNEIKQAWQVEWREQERTLLAVLQEPSQTLPVTPVVQLWTDRCDAEERREYQVVLERLGTGLTATELQYLAYDFSRCGTMAADQSFTQAVALAQAVARLEQWLMAADFISGIDTDYYQTRLTAWQAVRASTLDIQRAQYELDELQRALIVARQDGASVNGERIQTLLEEVQSAREALSDVTVTYRTRLRELSL